jgi:hypothetical protein
MSRSCVTPRGRSVRWRAVCPGLYVRRRTCQHAKGSSDMLEVRVCVLLLSRVPEVGLGWAQGAVQHHELLNAPKGRTLCQGQHVDWCNPPSSYGFWRSRSSPCAPNPEFACKGFGRASHSQSASPYNGFLEQLARCSLFLQM